MGFERPSLGGQRDVHEGFIASEGLQHDRQVVVMPQLVTLWKTEIHFEQRYIPLRLRMRKTSTNTTVLKLTRLWRGGGRGRRSRFPLAGLRQELLRGQ